MDVGSPETEIIPARKLTATVDGLFLAAEKTFETQARDELVLTFDGIQGDFHAGAVRRSSGREPWYPRGTELRNERQLTIVSRSELSQAAALMGVSEIRPEWIGANMTLAGVPSLTLLPASTLLFFEGGVTLKVDALNSPCKVAGRKIAQRLGLEDVEAGALLFPKHAQRLRGVTAWVEKPGIIQRGENVTVRVPKQWIWRG